MSTVAAGISIALSGLFAPDGRYFEFNEPLRLEIEQEDGVWIHRLPELDIWSFGPTRDDSCLGLSEMLAGDYDSFAMRPDEGLGKEALRLKQLLLVKIKRVV